MEHNYSVEFNAEIHSDLTGDKVEVGYDKDGLDLCRLSSDGIELFLTWKQAELVAQSIQQLVAIRS